MIKKVKNTVSWTCAISDLNGEGIARRFYEKELQETNPKKFKVEKAIKRKGDKLYVKWNYYNRSFSRWTYNLMDIFQNQNLWDEE